MSEDERIYNQDAYGNPFGKPFRLIAKIRSRKDATKRLEAVLSRYDTKQKAK